MTFRLPAILRVYRFKLLYFLVWTPYIATYQLTNRFPLFVPRELTLTALDKAVPFIPALLPLYVSYIPLYWWTVTRSENDREVNRIFYMTHLQLLLSLPFFILFPVRMPRELFYASQAHNWADAFWCWFDAPNNCFPSLHVSNCLALIVFNWHRPGRWPLTLFTSLVIASTLFVKQHYAVDLLGAGVVFVVSWWFLCNLEVTGVDEAGWLPARRVRRPGLVVSPLGRRRN